VTRPLPFTLGPLDALSLAFACFVLGFVLGNRR
jgi:hypothetical protein